MVSENLEAAFLVVLACTIGIFANGKLLFILLKRPQYGKYVHFHTVAKAGTNAMALSVFFIAEVPNLIAGDEIYPEFLFRTCGSLAGISAIPGRLFQFFLSFGTCFIAFFPLRPFPEPLFIFSVFLPSIAGIAIFCVRISSVECSYQFSVNSFAWFYYSAPCAQAVQKVVAKLVQFQIASCCCFNFITFTKLIIEVGRHKIVENAQMAKRLSKTKWRLVQCVAQDILFIIDASVYFNESDGYGLFFNFVFNTYVWNLAHMVDGIIMLAMLNKVKLVSPSAASVVVAVSRLSNKINTMSYFNKTSWKQSLPAKKIGNKTLFIKTRKLLFKL